MTTPTTSPFITRVVIENYKSIAACDVRLGPLNVLVGLNGSGKSNFLDALRFVRDVCNSSLTMAVQARGGIDEVRHRSGGLEGFVGLRLEFQLPYGVTGYYAFRILVRQSGGYSVREEECVIDEHKDGQAPARFTFGDGKYDTNVTLAWPSLAVRSLSPNDLCLASIFSNDFDVALFSRVSRALGSMRFYDINPGEMRGLTKIDLGSDAILSPDDGNITHVLQGMTMDNEAAKKRIDEYMARIAPNVRAIQARSIVDQAILQFRHNGNGNAAAEPFLGPAMSNGTLRALGVLVALFQSTYDATRATPLVAIEEPEVAIHPAAVRVLVDAMREASASSQVIATSHSPDLLDYEFLDADSIVPVTFDDSTRVGHLNEFGLSALRDHLYTAGELLRMNQLEPEITQANGRGEGRVALFDWE